MLELKIIADIGVIGILNADKSTILNTTSNSRPKVGHWEFTTLTLSVGTVILGVIDIDDTFYRDRHP